MINVKLLARLTKYAITGTANTVIDFAVYNLILLCCGRGNATALLANTLGFACANINSYLLNSFWTFRDCSRPSRREGAKFFLASLGTLTISSALLWALLTFIPGGGPAWLNLAKLTAGLTGSGINFIIYKLVVFHRQAAPIPPAEWSEAKLYPGCYVSLIIPAYNEAGRIGRTLQEAGDYLLRLQRPVELLVVDDGSTDDTAREVLACRSRFPFIRLISQPVNRGKGAALRRGIQEAAGELVIFFDADRSFPVEKLADFIFQLEKGYAAVIGRRVNTGRGAYPGRWRSLVSRGAHLTAHVLGLGAIKDTQCGFKGFRRREIVPLLSRTRIDRFAFDLEWLYLIRSRGLTVMEIPLNWQHRNGSSVRWTDVLESLLSVLKIRLWAWEGVYDLPVKKKVRSHFHLISAIIIFVAALAVRLPYLWSVPGFVDEWGEVGLAYKIYQGLALPLHNSAHDIGAFYNYLLAGLFALFGPDIYLPRLFMAVASAATVVLTYFLANALAGRLAGWLAAALMATCGMHILVTHMAWSNDLTPFFVTAALLCLVTALQRGSGRLLCLSGALWGLALQTHSSVLALLPGLLLYLWLGPARQGWSKRRSFYLAHLAFVLAYSNMIVDNIINPLDSWHWVQRKQYAFNNSINPASYLINLRNMTGEYISALASAYPGQHGTARDIAFLAVLLAGALLTAGVIWAVRRRQFLLLSIIASGLLVIPLFNHQYRFFTGTRYIAFLFAPSYALIGAALAAGRQKLTVLHRRRKDQQPAASPAGKMRRCLAPGLAVALFGLITFYPLAPLFAYYHQSVLRGQDNQPAFQLVNALAAGSEPGQLVLVDGRLRFTSLSLNQMLEISRIRHLMVGAPAPRGEANFPPPLEKWRSLIASHSNRPLVAVLTPPDFQLLTGKLDIKWDEAEQVAGGRGRPAYIIARLTPYGKVI